jgi:hypothetical protein
LMMTTTMRRRRRRLTSMNSSARPQAPPTRSIPRASKQVRDCGRAIHIQDLARRRLISDLEVTWARAPPSHSPSARAL